MNYQIEPEVLETRVSMYLNWKTISLKFYSYRSYFPLNVWHPSSSLRTGLSARTEKKNSGSKAKRFEEREAQGERSVPLRFGERIRSQALSAVMQRHREK